MEQRLIPWVEEQATHSVADPITYSILSTAPESLAAGDTRYGRFRNDISQFKSDSLMVVGASGEALETLLITSALRYFFYQMGNPDSPTIPDWVETTREGGQLEVLLVTALKTPVGEERNFVTWAITRAGGNHTLNVLENLPAEFVVDAGWLSEIVEKLRARLARIDGQSSSWSPHDVDMSPGIREDKRTLKNADFDGKDFDHDAFNKWCDAFFRLSIRQPKHIASYLSSLDTALSPYEVGNQNLAVWFATFPLREDGDRKTYFQTLAKADDPAIRAVGASFLALESPEAGLALLERMAGENWSGQRWAAAMLVTHGDRRFVEQALAEGDETKSPVQFHLYWWETMLPTLSNSAKDSGVPQPEAQRWRGLDSKEYREDLLTWWKQYGAQITLTPLPYAWPPRASLTGTVR